MQETDLIYTIQKPLKIIFPSFSLFLEMEKLKKSTLSRTLVVFLVPAVIRFYFYSTFHLH